MRPNWNSEEDKLRFIGEMKQSVGKKYDALRTTHLIFSSSIFSLGQFKEHGGTDCVICAHHIYYGLLRHNQLFRSGLNNHIERLDVKVYGTWTLEDFLTLAKLDKTLFKYYMLYPDQKLTIYSPSNVGFIDSFKNIKNLI